jgi:two-component system, sensor histidine kinase and response regulator
LRAHAQGGETSIVFLTAVRDVDTFDEALEAGGDDFLTKPLRPAELVVRVRAALALQRLSAENRGYFATIREQRDAVMRLQLQKEQLTAFLVHDLKNPVNALDLHAQLLLRDKSLSERSAQAARAIRQDARRLLQLITNMLDINKGGAGELSACKVALDPRALIEGVAAEFSVRAEERAVALKTEVSLDALTADPDLLRRILENLLDNAIRHAPARTSIVLSAARLEGGVELRVSDQGPGVPEALRAHVFDQFVQADKGGPRPSGYGLGLAFCRLAVAAHDGTIWVEDGAPGAVFCVRIPDPG